MGKTLHPLVPDCALRLGSKIRKEWWQKSFVNRRYRSLKKFERELEAIVDGYIYCAAYETLNDPMEGVFRSSTAFRESEDYRQARANIVDNKTQIGLPSFSEVYDHELMWAHYADASAVVCGFARPRSLVGCGSGVASVCAVTLARFAT
jgi:hypothetical protein